MLLHDEQLAGLSIAERIGKGLVLVPEDRQRDGLVQTMSVGENLSLASIRSFVTGLLTSRSREKVLVDASIRNVHIKTAGGGAAIGSLSGGNQQKVVIGKMLATDPKAILLDEPSRGIDIGAKSEVFRLLGEKARQGPRRDLFDVGSAGMPERRAQDRGDAQRQDLGGVRPRRPEGRDHGRFGRSRRQLI